MEEIKQILSVLAAGWLLGWFSYLVIDVVSSKRKG